MRSKTDVAMKNEVLAKCVCHNICCLIQSMHEFGVDPACWAEPMKLPAREVEPERPSWLSGKAYKENGSASV